MSHFMKTPRRSPPQPEACTVDTWGDGIQHLTALCQNLWDKCIGALLHDTLPDALLQLLRQWIIDDLLVDPLRLLRLLGRWCPRSKCRVVLLTTFPVLAILGPIEEQITTLCRSCPSHECKRRSQRRRAAPLPPASPSSFMARPQSFGNGKTEK